MDADPRDDVSRDEGMEEAEKFTDRPWQDLGLEKDDFMGLVKRIHASPTCLKSGEGDGQLLHRLLFSDEEVFTPELCREIVGWILAGTTPTEWLHELSEQGKSSICGHIYKKEEMVFKCSTCATDPTCCVCARCFEGSDCVANGHQYQIFKAGAGGCCDCGDSEAWSPSGFCKRHSGPVQDNPLESMATGVRFVAEELLSIILLYCCRALSREAGTAGELGKFITCLHNDAVHDFNQVETAVRNAAGCASNEAKRLTLKAHTDGYTIIKKGEEAGCTRAYEVLQKAGLISNLTREGWFKYELRASELLKLIRDMCGCCNGLRRIVCNLLLSDYPDAGSAPGAREGFKYVDLLMRTSQNFWPGVQIGLHDFYIQMIAEDAFKNKFADIFVSQYPELMQTFKDSKTAGSVTLLDLSVQIFTVPTVVTRLVEEKQLLEILFTVLNDFFDCQPNARQVSVTSAVIRDQLYERVCHDIKYVLRIPGCAMAFWGREEAVNKWLELCTRIQGMDPHTRQRHQHIEFEMRSWSLALELAIEFVPIHKSIISGYRESLGEYTGLESRHHALRQLSKMAGAMSSWFRQSQLLDEQDGDIFCNVVDSQDGYLFGMISYDVSTLPISFHIPCHRIFASCWSECISWCNGELDLGCELATSCADSRNEITSGEKMFALMMLEYPLRIFLVLAQNQAGMWIRNGLAIPGQHHAYCGPLLCENMYETDVVALQLACCILGADTFVRVLKHRFGVSKWLGDDQLSDTSDSSDQTIVLLEEMINLIILALMERSHLNGDDDHDLMKQRVIHRLAIGPQTHSTLMRTLPKAATDDVLHEISDFRRPDATQSGIFELKTGLLETVNPFSCYLSRKEREIVRGVKLTKCGDSLPSFPPIPSCMSGLRSLLLSPVLWRVIRRILFIALSHATDASFDKTRFVTDTLIHEVLHILCLAIALAKAEVGGWQDIGILLLEGGIDGVAGLLARLAGCGGCLVDGCRFHHSEHKQLFLRLVSSVSEGSPNIAILLGNLKPVVVSEGQGETEAEEGAERAKRQKEARERALAQMAEQQRAFAAMMVDGVDENEGSEDMDWQADSSQMADISITNELMQEDNRGYQCVLCHEIAALSRPLGLICCAQASSVVSVTAGVRYGSPSPTNTDDLRRDCALDEACQFGWEMPGCQQGHGVALSFCGHTMHQDCLDRYITSLELRLQSTGIGHGAAVTEGEFPCPLCRSLGNALVPILPRENFAAPEPSGDACQSSASLSSMSVKELKCLSKNNGVNITGCAEKIDIVNALALAGVSGSEAVRASAGPTFSPGVEEMLEKMSKKMFLAHDRMCRLKELRGMAPCPRASTFSSNTACACSTAVYTLTAAETAARLGSVSGGCTSGGFILEADLFHLTVMVRAVRAVAESSSAVSSGDWRWRKLAEWAQLLIGTTEGREQGLVGHDVWALFAHWLVLLKPSKGLNDEFEGVARIIWAAKVFQVISGLLQQGNFDCIFEQPDSNGPIESLIRLVAAEMGLHHSSKAMDTMSMETDGAGTSQEDAQGGVAKPRKGVSGPVVDMEASLASCCLPFLRRAALLRATLLGLKLPILSGKSQMSDSAQLLKFMQLSGRFGLGSIDGPVRSLVIGWCRQIKILKAKIPSSYLTQSLNPPALHPLKEWYHDMLKLRLQESCTRCNTLPDEPAICLLCGTLVCAGNECCKQDGETGECTRHAISCGAGCAPFLFVKQCLLVLIRVGSGCRHNTPYLDAYGEEDPALKRGRPLQLSNERYARLLQLWAFHKIYSEIARSSQNRGGTELLWDSI